MGQRASLEGVVSSNTQLATACINTITELCSQLTPTATVAFQQYLHFSS